MRRSVGLHGAWEKYPAESADTDRSFAHKSMGHDERRGQFCRLLRGLDGVSH
jgi:hypothetical protein